MKLTAKTLFGLEDILAKEIEDLGGTNIEKLNRAVRYEGDTELLYRSNLCLRTAIRVLIPISSFTAHNDRHLYSLAGKINWSKYIGEHQSFAIDSTTNSERFKHSQYAALKVKDAIVDQFKEKTGDRPNVDTQNPDVRINLHISETEVNISLDSSGESLERRGYRTESNEAPISEALAAGLLLLAGWHGQTPLLDPMCGSGTIPIEAALIATNTPSGLHRNFGFQNWFDYDEALFKKIDFELRDKIKAPEHLIVGRDIDSMNVSISKRNAMRAGVIDEIVFEQMDFLKSDPIAEEATIVMNPPYGERLEEEEEMIDFYLEIGARLKHHFTGHQLWVISSNLRAIKRLGFKPDHKHKLYNGSLECRYNGYSIFAGKRVVKNDESESDPSASSPD